MEWKQMVSENRQDDTESVTAALVAVSLPLMMLAVTRVVAPDGVGDRVALTLVWLGIATTITAIILGSLGIVVAAQRSDLRALSVIAVVLGVIQLVAIVALYLFALALGEYLNGYAEL
jgi:hypothetical protein